VVKTSFDHIQSTEQSKIDVFIPLIFLQFSLVFLRNVTLCTAEMVVFGSFLAALKVGGNEKQ
jgi:hypothetical protein